MNQHQLWSFISQINRNSGLKCLISKRFLIVEQFA